MKKTTLCLFLVMVSAWGCGLLYGQQEVVIQIREGVPVIPMAIPAFIAADSSEASQAAARTLRDVITADLEYSRVFKPIQETHYRYLRRPLNPEQIFFKDWEELQANLLIVGVVKQGEQAGTFQFEGKIYDVKSERLMIGKSYTAETGLTRLVAHRFADELMQVYGEPPLFTTKIVFCSNRDGNWELYMMDYDGHNQTRLTFNTFEDYMPAWSADGRRIAYTSFEGASARLVILHPFEGRRELVFDQGTSFSPSFSPDDKWLAFCSQEDKSNTDIYVASSDGKNPRRITFSKAADTAPTWSPTSREIAFTSDRLGTPQIFIMDREGSNVRRVSFGGTYHDGPAWAPTGDRIVYVSRVESVFDMYVLDLRSNEIMKLSEGYARNEFPCWSPDGRHILFQSNRYGSTNQVFSIDYDGKNIRQLTSKGQNKLADWAHKSQ
jgi:TolB protein